MRASIVLTSSESKRLIAKAVTKISEVKRAMSNAYLILHEGSTNALIAEELFGIEQKSENFTSGFNSSGMLCRASDEVRGNFPIVAYKGKIIDMEYEKALKENFNPETVIIKGGNAIDKEGKVGIIVSGFDGGSLMRVLGVAVSQGLKVISPVGLEKCVFSVSEAARYTGGKKFDYSMGPDYGVFVLSQADVITEIQAIKLLTGANAYHVASGGIGGSEGSVILSCEGSEKQVSQLVDLVESIKGEAQLRAVKTDCTECGYINCTYYGKQKSELPSWIQD